MIESMDGRKKKNVSSSTQQKQHETMKRKALMEQEKRKKPGECLKVLLKVTTTWQMCIVIVYMKQSILSLQYIVCIIDTNIMNEPFGSRIKPNLDNLGVRSELRRQTIGNIISWQRSSQRTFINANDMVIIQSHNITYSAENIE